MSVEEPVVDPSWSDAPETNEHARFRDIYEILDGSNVICYCIYTSLNDVIFLEDITIQNYTADSALGTMASDCIPSIDQYITCVVDDGTNFTLTYCKIDSTGQISIPVSYVSATIHLRGLSYNNCANYFNPI